MGWSRQLLCKVFPVLFLSLVGTAATPVDRDQIKEDIGNRPAFSIDARELLETFQSIPPEEADDFQILLEEAKFLVDAESRVTYTYRLIYKILSPGGLSGGANVEVQWKPWYQNTPSLRARVITLDGEEHWLDPATIGEFSESQQDPTVFDDVRALRAPLPALEVGAIVEEEETIQDAVPFFAGGIAKRFYFGGNIPFHRVRLILEAPSSLSLNFSSPLVPEEAIQKEEKDGRIRISVSMGPLEAIRKSNDSTPSDVPDWPHVGFSTGKSWQHLAEEYGRIVDSKIDLQTIGPIVEEATADADSREDKIRHILARLHRDVRYTGIEFGEGAIVPRTLSEVLTRKYGDCKDKATLLVGMLRAAGIESYVALLNTNSSYDVEPGLPGLGLFDHAIVYLPGDPAVWIDPTADYARPGLLPSADQGRQALIAHSESTGLIQTPVTSTKENLMVETREVFLAESGPGRVVETSESWGEQELFFRGNYATAKREDTLKNLEDYGKSYYLADAASGIEYTEASDFSGPFQIRLEAEKAKRTWSSGSNAGVAIPLASLTDRLPEDLQKEKKEEDEAQKAKPADYVLKVPFLTQWRYKIHPPPGFQPAPLPDDASDPVGPAVYRQSFRIEEDESVSGLLEFETPMRRLSPQELKELRDGAVEFRKRPALLIKFDNIGQTYLEAGKIREALGEFRELESLHPQEALHHTQIALALLAGGMGEAARKQARRAIEVEPDSSLAHRTLGWILQHDLIGRRFQKGFDRTEAIAAYRVAVEKDPEDLVANADLAILLEHGEDGVRYSETADMEEAIAQYRKIEDKLKGTGLANNLPIALLWAKRFDELDEYIRDLDKPDRLNTYLLAATAGREGADAALEEAKRAFTQDSARRSALRQAGELLIRLRKYPEAATLLKAGAQGASDAAAILGRVQMIERTQRFDESPIPVHDPVGLLHKLFIRSILDDSREQLAPLFAGAIQDDLQNEEYWQTAESAIAGSRNTGLNQLRRLNIPLDIALDLALSNVQISKLGDDHKGYRVRARFPGANANSEFTLYVVREDGEYRILGVEEFLSPLGLEVLHRVETEDLAGARQLLDWVREDISLRIGDDPLEGPLFPRFWTKGSEDGIQAIRLAAAVLALDAKHAADQIPILISARKQAESEESLRNLDLALYRAYSLNSEPEQQLTVARRLYAAHPRSVTAFQQMLATLRQLQKWEDVNQLIRERLELLPDDRTGLREQVQEAWREEDYERAGEIYRKIVELGRATSFDYNNFAWQFLFFDPQSEEAFLAAQRGNQLSQNQNPSELHTLACFYAERDQTVEARDIILHAMDLAGMEEPTPAFWYVFGRIAEQYGELEAARSYYDRVTPPEGDPILPTYDLAQKRLEILKNREQ